MAGGGSGEEDAGGTAKCHTRWPGGCATIGGCGGGVREQEAGSRGWSPGALARLSPSTQALAGSLVRPRPHIQAMVPVLAPLSTHGLWLTLVSSYVCAFAYTPWLTRVPMWALARPLRRVGAGGRVCGAEGPHTPPPHRPTCRAAATGAAASFAMRPLGVLEPHHKTQFKT